MLQLKPDRAPLYRPPETPAALCDFRMAGCRSARTAPLHTVLSAFAAETVVNINTGGITVFDG
jgi:hypothetical protein